MCRRTRRRCGMPRVASESASSLAAADTSALAPLAWCTRARPRCSPGCIGWWLCPPHPPRRGRLEASVIFKIKIIFTCVQNMGENWDIRQLQRSLRKRKQNFSLRGYTLQEEIRTRSDFNQLDYAQIGPSMAHFSNLSLSNQVAAANLNLKIPPYWVQTCCQDSWHNSE